MLIDNRHLNMGGFNFVTIYAFQFQEQFGSCLLRSQILATPLVAHVILLPNLTKYPIANALNVNKCQLLNISGANNNSSVILPCPCTA